MLGLAEERERAELLDAQLEVRSDKTGMTVRGAHVGLASDLAPKPRRHKATRRTGKPVPTTDNAILIAAVISLGAVVLGVVRSSSGQDTAAIAAVLLSVGAAVLSWCLVNTVFALKYARLYYVDQDGGIDFKQEEPPAYSDFAYLAFTVGMSFAVSETEPATPQSARSRSGMPCSPTSSAPASSRWPPTSDNPDPDREHRGTVKSLIRRVVRAVVGTKGISISRSRPS